MLPSIRNFLASAPLVNRFIKPLNNDAKPNVMSRGAQADELGTAPHSAQQPLPGPKTSLAKPKAAEGSSAAALSSVPSAEVSHSLEPLFALFSADKLTKASNEEIASTVDKAFEAEFAILKTATTDVRTGDQELLRSQKAVMSAIWMHKGNYESYVKTQPPPVKLSKESFDAARKDLMGEMTPTQLLTLCCCIAANDLGKSTSWAQEVATKLGQPALAKEDHDVILEAAAKAGLVPSFEQLPAKSKQLIMDGLKMGSELNAPAWMQGEAPAATLNGVMALRGKPEAFKLKSQEIYHDVAGAVTHLGPKPMEGIFMLEPMSKAFVKGFGILADVISGKIQIPDAYRKPFAERATWLAEHGFTKNLSVAKPEEFALLRLMSLGRTVGLGWDDTRSLEQASVFLKAFEGLPENVRQGLVNGMTVTGIDDGKAIFPSMAPEVFVQATTKLVPPLVEARKSGADVAAAEMKAVEGLKVVLTVLNQALAGTKPVAKQAGSVVMADLRPLVATVKDGGFENNVQVLTDKGNELFGAA